VAARRKKTPAVKEAAPPEESAVEAPAVEEEQPQEEEQRPDDGRRWYVIHTYSGYEDKVKTNLEHRVQNMDVADLIFEVVVPCVDEIEIRDGQRRTVPRKIFPGYVLVQMIELKQEDDTSASSEERMRSSRAWYVVRNTPGVTGFVGSGQHPTPLEETEVSSILRQMRSEEPRVKVGFALGQSVRIIDGPFIDFIGTVDDLNLEKGKVKVLVSFFGRETPVELDFLQVERL
jgi:transcriptional antiterminator NusG